MFGKLGIYNGRGVWEHCVNALIHNDLIKLNSILLHNKLNIIIYTHLPMFSSSFFVFLILGIPIMIFITWFLWLSNLNCGTIFSCHISIEIGFLCAIRSAIIIYIWCCALISCVLNSIPTCASPALSCTSPYQLDFSSSQKTWNFSMRIHYYDWKEKVTSLFLVWEWREWISDWRNLCFLFLLKVSPPWVLFNLSTDHASLKKEIISTDVGILSPSMGGPFWKDESLCHYCSFQIIPQYNFPSWSQPLQHHDLTLLSNQSFQLFLFKQSSHRKGNSDLLMDQTLFQQSWICASGTFSFCGIPEKCVIMFCYSFLLNWSDWRNLVYNLGKGFDIRDPIILLLFLVWHCMMMTK